VLGGEQSGHVICADLASTGDGMLAGLQLLSVVARSGRPLADLATQVMVQYPQVLKNLRMNQQHPELIEKLGPAIEAAERELGEEGRILVRLSGTEPLLRVMVEHADQSVADATADTLLATAVSFIG
jgi:phosphoglucosamine mutase